MAKNVSEMQCAIWAHIRDAGGYHSAAEIALEFALKPKLADRHLKKLFERRHLARTDEPMGRKRIRHLYGYIKACIAMPGQSAEPLK